jgi:hypothetical protein
MGSHRRPKARRQHAIIGLVLRFLMPASGFHADPAETGEFLAVDEPEDIDLTRVTRADYALDSYYQPVTRPYLPGRFYRDLDR